MKKAIEILKSYIRTYQGQIELYEYDPHNQAITEYSANEAKKNIEELNKAINILEKDKIDNITICANDNHVFNNSEFHESVVVECPVCKTKYSYDKITTDNNGNVIETFKGII